MNTKSLLHLVNAVVLVGIAIYTLIYYSSLMVSLLLLGLSFFGFQVIDRRHRPLKAIFALLFLAVAIQFAWVMSSGGFN